jgi:uncharacterized membrane protein
MATLTAPMSREVSRRTRAEPWSAAARALGWLGVTLGAAELLAPRAVGALIGVDRPWTLRTLGMRELASGAGILAQPGQPAWLWSRVAGDAIDLALLAAAWRSSAGRRGRLAAATGTVVLVTALDVLCSRQAVRTRAEPQTLELRTSIAVQRSAQELFRFWRDLSNLPRFMLYLKEVREIDARRSHWSAEGPAGVRMQWDSEITEEQPDRRIAWQTVAGAPTGLSGEVRFESAPAGEGTLVHLRVHYTGAGRMVAGLMRVLTRESIKHQLRRLKQLMETGEIATTLGQPSGPRSKVVRLVERVVH